MLELGTKEYPYKRFRSVSSEILIQHSFSDKEIIIYLKENKRVYIEDDTTYFLDIGAVTITSYSDSGSSPGKALIVPTAIAQPQFDGKAAFHILVGAEIPIASMILLGNYQESNLVKLNQKETTIKFVKTNFSLLNVDVYREVIDYNLSKYFLRSIYLQDRDVAIKNVEFNVTGTIMENDDPLNFYMENVVFDAYSLINGFDFQIN